MNHAILMSMQFLIKLFTYTGIVFLGIQNLYSADKPSVFVSILPQKYFVKRIAEENIDVHVMVGQGQSPETYEPKPKQIASLQKAKVFFLLGVPYEKMLVNQVSELNPKLDLITCCKEINRLELSDNEQEELDPHIWTSPKIAILIASTIKDKLIKLDPESASFYEKNYAMLYQDLNNLDMELREKLAGTENRILIVSHPSWGYFAREYNLRQISIEQHGKEIKAKSLTELIEFSRKESIRKIFVQKQSNSASAYVLAKEIGAQVIELDPLSEDYIENLKMVANAIVNGK